MAGSEISGRTRQTGCMPLLLVSHLTLTTLCGPASRKDRAMPPPHVDVQNSTPRRGWAVVSLGRKTGEYRVCAC